MPRTFFAKKSKRGADLTCLKCDKKIKAGEQYKYFYKRYGFKSRGVRMVYCSSCTILESDKSSNKMAPLWDAQNGAQKEIDGAGCVDDIKQALQDLQSTAEDLKQECEESLENMPEQLRESSAAGETLNGYIEALDSYISELESFDSSADEDDSDALDQAKDEARGIVENFEG